MIIEHASKKLEAEPDDVNLLGKRARAYSKIGFVDENSRDIVSAPMSWNRKTQRLLSHKSVNLHQSGDKGRVKEILCSAFWMTIPKS